MIRIKVKRLNQDAVIPKYSKTGDAGMDLTATGYRVLSSSIVEYRTGLAFEIPDGYVGLIFPRSSISNTTLTLANAVGVVDSGYRGEVTFRFRGSPFDKNSTLYQKGDRIGQLVVLPYPDVFMVETEDLSETERGTGGYGSTGK